MPPLSRLIVAVERDSVCAGDDMDAPHPKRFNFDASVDVADAVAAIVESGYLANIAGGKATWIVEVAGKAVAVVAQQWKSPKFLITSTTRLANCLTPETSNVLYFRYWCQIAPDVVFNCLESGRPLPDMFGRDG